MLRKWLKINYPEALLSDLDYGLEEWLEVWKPDIYSEYLDLIKPAKILEGILCGLEVTDNQGNPFKLSGETTLTELFFITAVKKLKC